VFNKGVCGPQAACTGFRRFTFHSTSFPRKNGAGCVAYFDSDNRIISCAVEGWQDPHPLSCCGVAIGRSYGVAIGRGYGVAIGRGLRNRNV
jgi:hypothetical protein